MADRSSNNRRAGGRHGHGHTHQPYAPPPNTVQRGTVTRLEPYGCFVQLQSYRARGLVHKSQLATYRVENVDDAVTLNDEVWVKVVDVTKDIDEESGKMRHRVSLSMKFASQDDGTDLDPSGEKAAEDMARRGDGGGGRGGADGGDNNGIGGGGGIATALERSLGSNIGMASAIDPMAAMRTQQRVVLRGSARGAACAAGAGGGVTFNGYALVDDDEGEPDLEPPAATATATTIPAAAVAEPSKPMGRGRGTTLPAWMTRDDGPTGAPEEKRRSSRSKSRSRSEDSSSNDRRKRRKKKESSRRKQKKKHKSRDRRRSRSRSRDRDRRKDSRSSGRRKDRDRKRDRHEDRKQRRRRRSRSHSRSRSRSRSYSSDRSRSDRSRDADDEQFASVEEAKALIASLEKEKAERRERR